MKEHVIRDIHCMIEIGTKKIYLLIKVEFNDISCIQQRIKCEVANSTDRFEVFYEKLWIKKIHNFLIYCPIFLKFSLICSSHFSPTTNVLSGWNYLLTDIMPGKVFLDVFS